MDFTNQHFDTTSVGSDANSITNFVANGGEVIINYDTGETDPVTGAKIYHSVVVDDMQAFSTGGNGILARDPQNNNEIVTLSQDQIESVVGITGMN